MIAHWTSIPSLATLIPFATIFLFGQGPGAVARAMMRRQRKFVRLAAIQSGSMAFACLLAVAAALSGWGTVALIFQRMMPFIAYPVISVVTALGRGRNAVLIPRWNKTCFDELSRVSWYQLLRIGFEYMTPAAMSLLVNGLFGTAILGQLNIAMRLTEPLRSGIASIGHNIVVTQLKQAEVRGENIANSTAKIVTNMAAVFVPAFFGIAVCAPVLLPLLVGPGWDESIPIAKTLCLAAAISVPFRYLYSGFLVSGRPEYGVICAGLSFLAMMLAIPMIWWAGDASDIGLAQVLAEATVMVTGGLLLLRFGKLSDLQPLLSVVKIWAAAALMYILAGYPYFNLEFAMPKFWGLMMIAVNGAIIYTLLLYIFCRDCFNNLYILVYRRDS